ncbi:uncharacterized protein N0V96_000294 [Colletotrichum fioriniae]|uniref:uncharacterized protein n=1 Tax=Colletotrichum fioriniae TaxID=710243 RepID=UPI0032D9E6DA|nr:hypothetical protein N0V96_000294 [Colletotrichum fioriniae]
MRLPGPSMPSQRQSQTAAGIALVILALFTAFAVTQAVRPSQAESTLSQRDNIVQARQFLPWIFGGDQTTTIASPAQPAITTPLPAAAPPTPNNQQQQGPLGGVIPQVGHIIPSLLASLTSALAAVVTPVPSILNPGNVVPVVTKVVPAPVESILHPGGGPVIPTAIPNVEGSNGGLLPPIQSAVNSIVGVGGSTLPLPTGPGLPVPVPTQVVGGIPVSEVTAAIGNGASIITNIPEVLVSVVSSIVGHIPSAVNNLPSAIPVSDVVGATAVVPGLSSLVASVLQSASVIMPLPTTAPQLPEDLPTDGNLCTGVNRPQQHHLRLVARTLLLLPAFLRRKLEPEALAIMANHRVLLQQASLNHLCNLQVRWIPSQPTLHLLLLKPPTKQVAAQEVHR